MNLKASLPEKLKSRYSVYDYLSSADVAKYYCTAVVVISRAGAHTLYELLFLNTKAVLVPIPWSSHHEQEKNAGILADHRLAVILPQNKLTGPALISAIASAKQLLPRPLDLVSDGLERMTSLIISVFS